jgi:hypothetical protein
LQVKPILSIFHMWKVKNAFYLYISLLEEPMELSSAPECSKIV